MTIHKPRQRVVLENLLHLKEKISEQEEKTDKPRNYICEINCETGDIRFPEQQIGSNWRQMNIRVKNPKSPNEKAFELLEKNEKQPTGEGFIPLALQIVRDTLDRLNKVSMKVSEKERPIEKVIVENPEIFAIPNDDIEAQPGWEGEIDRYQAEVLLKGQKVGTYLLRESDSVTRYTEHRLSLENELPICSYILTYIGDRKKISEFMLIREDGIWTIYSDEPDIESNDLRFQGFSNLLQSLKESHVIHKAL